MTPTDRLQHWRSVAAEMCRRTFEPMLYTGGIMIYAAGVRVAALRNRKAALMIDGHRHSIERLQRALEHRGNRVVWVHAASLGEFEQGRPLMEEMRRRHPDTTIVLTFFSPSGYEVRQDWSGADVVAYLPFDIPSRVRAFLDVVRPDMAIFVKYEFWRNYLAELRRRQIPTYLISAVFRPDQAFFRRRSAWYRRWLHLYSHIYVQDERSHRLLAGVGVTAVTVAGDTRFDRVTDIMRTQHPIAELEAFKAAGTDLILMAGSSWPADEQVYLPWVHRRDVRLVVAPHEFDTPRLQTLLRECPDAVLFSQLKENPQLATSARTLIMDCFGLLSSAYAYADIAYVGGGFGAGLHNINEAAVYGIPVIYGPNNGKFIEAREMAEAGGGFPVDDAASFASRADTLLHDEKRRMAGDRAAAYIRSRLGATQTICNDLF